MNNSAFYDPFLTNKITYIPSEKKIDPLAEARRLQCIAVNEMQDYVLESYNNYLDDLDYFESL